MGRSWVLLLVRCWFAVGYRVVPGWLAGFGRGWFVAGSWLDAGSWLVNAGWVAGFSVLLCVPSDSNIAWAVFLVSV